VYQPQGPVPSRDLKQMRDRVREVIEPPAQTGRRIPVPVLHRPVNHQRSSNDILLRNGVVYRNGQPLDEVKYLDTDRDNPADVYRNNFPAIPAGDDPNVWTNWAIDMPTYIQGDDIVVPPNHYFAMGDHRGVSLDSRYWGFIPKENVIGRPMFIYWSFETPDDQYRKTEWTDRVKFLLGKVVLHFFDETRWKRTLKVVQ